MQRRVFTSGEVAAICGVSADTVSRWFDVGQIEGYRLGKGGDRRIPYDSLRKFMLNRGIPLDRLDEEATCILVVDDDPFYVDKIAQLLRTTNDYRVETASTGFDVGAHVVEFNPQLVILDIHLSDMDGRMVCQRIKGRAETANTRILAISGFIDSREEKELRDYGFDAYLKKPFGADALHETVRNLMSLPTAKLARPVHPSSGVY